MSKIYIASYDVALQFQHLYLVFENDLGEQFVIRGGPENDLQFSITDPNFSFGNVELEVDRPLTVSEDRFSVDRTGDGLPDTPSERNFTELDLGGRDAESVWQEFINFSQSLAVEPGADVDTFITNTLYSFSTANSNSFINSVLASTGIDLADQTPRDGGDEAGGDRFTLSAFPAATTFLSGSGDNAVSHLFIDVSSPNSIDFQKGYSA